MGLLCPIILILFGTMNHIRHQFSMRYTIASQLVGHDFSWFTTMTLHKTLEEALSRCTIPPYLQKHIDHFTILIDSSPEVILLAVDLHKGFVDEESVAIASVLSFQSTSVNGTELGAEPAPLHRV